YVETRVRCLLRGPGDQPALVRPFIARVGSSHHDPDCGAVVATVRAWMAMHDQAYVDAAALLAPSLATPAVASERRLLLLMASARVAARRGRVDDHDAIIV